MVGERVILRGNALTLPLADDTVDLVVTSPPYFGLRSYQDGGAHYAGQIGDEATPAEFIDALVAATAEMVRVVKPSGSIFVNLGDKYSQRPGQYPNGNAGAGDGFLGGARSEKHITARRGVAYTAMQPKSLMLIPQRYAIRCVDELGLILRAEIIWSKPNGLPESVTDRVRRSHESWFHFTLSPRYYSAVDEIRETTSRGGMTWAERLARGDATRQGEQSGTFGDGMAPNPLGKLPSSVWEIPTEPLHVPDHLGVDHFAAYPTEWPRRIIQGWSPPWGTVLDPFGGTGTTALVAHALGRHAVHVDMSADYCRLATWRTSDPKQRAKAARREYTPPPEQTTGQLDLLEGLGA
jgi:site-specific DNA-methyltransferase (cytosine-N4-specific)